MIGIKGDQDIVFNQGRPPLDKCLRTDAGSHMIESTVLGSDGIKTAIAAKSIRSLEFPYSAGTTNACRYSRI